MPPFELPKALFYMVKEHLLCSKRCSFVTRLIISQLHMYYDYDCQESDMILSDRLKKLHNGVAVGLRQIVELLRRPVCVALFTVRVPHYSLYLVARAAVVQTVLRAGVDKRQTTSPKRSGAAPRIVDVINHEQTVLHNV